MTDNFCYVQRAEILIINWSWVPLTLTIVRNIKKFANSLVKKFRSFNCNKLNKMFYYWQNKKLKLTSFEVVFIGGFTPKNPPFFGYVPGCLNPVENDVRVTCDVGYLCANFSHLPGHLPGVARRWMSVEGPTDVASRASQIMYELQRSPS